MSTMLHTILRLAGYYPHGAYFLQRQILLRSEFKIELLQEKVPKIFCLTSVFQFLHLMFKQFINRSTSFLNLDLYHSLTVPSFTCGEDCERFFDRKLIALVAIM